MTQQLNIKELMYERQYEQFLEFTEDLNHINEIKLPSFVQRKVDFIKDLSDKVGISFKEAVAFFRDKKVFKIFTLIKWSFAKLFEMVKKGYKAYNSILKIIPKFIAETGAGAWTEGKLRALDKWLVNHPKVRALGGVAVSAMLIYIWLNMSFTGDIGYDMNFDDIVGAFLGNYTLSDIFAGEDGIKMLMLFATGGVLGLSFPWVGATSVHFLGGTLVSIGKLVHKRIKTSKGIQSK